MSIPANRYFRILVVGSENARVAEIIERELHFRTAIVDPAGAADALTNGADLGAIIVAAADAEAVIKAREARGLRMPVFLLTTRDRGTLMAPYLTALDGVVIADVE